MKIAVIGYGSLIWDLECLEPRVDGPWQRAGGPLLPLEFSRISPKRRQALVLVVDDSISAPCATSHIASTRNRLEDAVDDLAQRERCRPEFISYTSRDGSRSRGTSRRAQSAVQAWLAGTRFDGAVWTGLPANFAEATGTPFSHDAALAYLQKLDEPSLAEAWRYMEYAPEETATPLRRHVRAQGWWQGLDFSGNVRAEAR